MNLRPIYIICICFFALTSCSDSVKIKQLDGGFEEVTYTAQSILGEPDSHQITLQHRDSSNKLTMIWPSTTGGKIVKSETILFEADKASNYPKSGERWPMTPRLFAVKATNCPIDVTDQILLQSTNMLADDFLKLSKITSIAYFNETNDMVVFHFGVMKQPDFPELTVRLNWNQILAIVREVKETGVERRDPRWDIIYIEKDIKPEIRR